MCSVKVTSGISCVWVCVWGKRRVWAVVGCAGSLSRNLPVCRCVLGQRRPVIPALEEVPRKGLPQLKGEALQWPRQRPLLR